MRGTITVECYDRTQNRLVSRAYEVPMEKGTTVLSSLLYIYERYDSTLAFRYGCRSSKCGQCAVNIDGVPRLACAAKAKDGTIVSPLKNLPLVRDLIVDRAPLDRRIRPYRLFVCPETEQPLGHLSVPETFKKLIGCLECYGCVSSCPHFDWNNEAFGGPYVFVRLAQLHLDPRDTEDRVSQAQTLGIQKCVDCWQCRCVKGIAIRRDAIGSLLNEQRGP